MTPWNESHELHKLCYGYRRVTKQRHREGYIVNHDKVKELTSHGFPISMSRKGNAQKSAHAESFIKSLESEEVELWEYRTMEDVQERIPYFIEGVYNQTRLRFSLGYWPPCQFEPMTVVTQNPCQRAPITAPQM